MLTHPTIDKLHQLRCPGMAAALAEPLHSPLCDAPSFEACPRVPSGERLGLLADRELTLRDDRRMASRLRRAKLRHPNAGIEDIDSRHPRRLDKALIHSLASALAARTPQRPHHRSHRRLPPSARIGGRQVLAPVPSLTTPAATASPHCPCASPGSCTTSPSPAATAATPSSSPPSPKPTSSSSTTSDSPSSTPTTAATSSELLEDRYASRSTLVTSQLPLAQWQTARRPHPRRRHPRPTRPQRLQAPTQGRLQAKTSLRLDPCRSLHGIIIAPRRFAPTGDRLAVVSELGERPFHVRAGLNAAVFDAVMTAFSNNLDSIPKDVKNRYESLVRDERFERNTRSSTTNIDVVQGRLRQAARQLFDA